MLTRNAKRIFCDNVTCFGTNKCCSNRSHLPEGFIKALRFLLAWLLWFYTKNPRFFLKGDIRNTPHCPGRHNSHFAFENEGLNMSLGFFSMASSLVLFVLGHGVETSNLGDVSAQKLCQGSADFSLEQVGIDVSAPCTYCNAPACMKVIHLMSTRPNMQEARERFKTIRSLCVVCVVFLQCSEIESDCFEIFQSQFETPRIPRFEFLSCAACWSKKQDAGMETNNAKGIFCDNVTCFGTNKCCSNRSHLQRVLQVLVTSCLQGCSFQLFPHTLYSFFLTVSCWLLSRHSVRTSWEF